METFRPSRRAERLGLMYSKMSSCEETPVKTRSNLETEVQAMFLRYLWRTDSNSVAGKDGST